MSVVSVVCCQVEDCDELITCRDESYQLCCVVVLSRTLLNQEALAHWKLLRQNNNT